MTKSDLLLVYAPGSSPDEWPDGMAKLIPRGSDLVFQLHYTANGKPATDQTSIGMIFAKEPPKQRVMTLQLTNSHFRIPPGDPAYRVEARGTVPNDALLLSFFPHLHLRGKEFEYNIVHPESGGQYTIEPLLKVKYNFYWQLSYRLAEPRFLKAGTELQAVAIFDNSRGNPHNPDPDAEVTWGDQTYNEMMVGFFDIAIARDVDKNQFFQDTLRRHAPRILDSRTAVYTEIVHFFRCLITVCWLPCRRPRRFRSCLSVIFAPACMAPAKLFSPAIKSKTSTLKSSASSKTQAPGNRSSSAGSPVAPSNTRAFSRA